ncbi:hypothetical protein LRS06_20840 [Hymenobacter sp. J193]|uniref:hypothetical protein n=1 Tax=Hymenobacter sp. J193 TaxID=2898429 RepID=UPI002151907E|nr:hypothetical protein [Hymenobacter sp. J193]MCR5890177.1 hypothetical protein [Hymenobacter sp. J193]
MSSGYEIICRRFSLCMIIIIIAISGCTRVVHCANFMYRNNYNKVVVPMNNMITASRNSVVIDSLAAVRKIINKVKNDNKNIRIVLYYNGSMHSEFRLVNFVAHRIRDKIIEEGFHESKISCDVKWYQPESIVDRYTFRKMDFIIY